MTKTVWLVGQGVVGRRIARFLTRTIDRRWVTWWDPRAVPSIPARSGDVVVLVQPTRHADLAAKLVERGVNVVSVGDRVDDAERFLEMNALAIANDTTVVPGAAFAPGLAGLLARLAARQVAVVDEVHVAVHGTAGPACARYYHDSLSHKARSWRDGVWHDHVGGSGRDLVWFPEPVGAQDSYLAAMTDPILLHEVFPDASRISARRTARRRDRLTARLPMLRPPHPEGAIGALRVEVSGADAEGGRVCLVYGIAELVATAAAATASAVTLAVYDNTLPKGVVVLGDERLDTVALLRSLESFHVRVQTFTGVPHLA